jgi:peptidoglycan pentaglycine glycine transferase (the first glycine)
MEFGLINEQSIWNQLVEGIHPNQFLQLWQWGEFQSSLGRKVWRFKIEREGEIVSLGQAIGHVLPFGLSYIYLPRGPLTNPIAKNHPNKFLEIFITGIKEFVQKEIFVRAESTDFDFGEHGWQKVRDVQPSHTAILNLERDEDEILAGMHQKTRYNIRVAGKHEVAVRKMDASEFDKFWELIEVTTERDKFRAHPKNYYKKMLESLGDMAEVWFAEYKGNVIAANLMILWGDTVVYLHGASSREHKNVMAPYLLHWELIKRAKADGYKYYDFWGIAPLDAPNHLWAGITRFKKGFGGTEVTYPGTFDLPISKFWYLLYKLRTRR